MGFSDDEVAIRRKKRSRSSSPSSSDSDSGSGKSRKLAEPKKAKKKKSKKSKKKKKKKKELSVNDRWGSRGMCVRYRVLIYNSLREEDVYTKEAEFRAWLQEIKRVAFQSLGQFQMKEMFAEYAEDFNCICLPHEKYYDLAAWEAKERGYTASSADAVQESSVDIRKVSGSLDNAFIRQDERDARFAAKKKKRLTNIAELQAPSKKQLLELKRVQEERISAEKLRKIGAKPREGMGVLYERKDKLPE